MKTPHKDSTLQFLSSITKNHLGFDTRLAILSLYNQPYSCFVEGTIVFLEYFQLVAQAFLFNLALYEDPTSNQNPLLKLIINASKVVNPGSFLTNHTQSTYNLVMSIILGLLMLKYILTAYICVITVKNGKQEGFFIGMWRWVFKLQGRVIYLLLSSVLMEIALTALNNGVKTFGLTETVIMTICMTLICFEYIFSLILQIRFCNMLPTKSILSGKDTILETSTLTQKFITQVLQLIFSSMPDNAWIIVIFNLVFSLARVAYFFRTLPLYNVKILLYQGVLISVVSIANLTCLVQTIADSTDQDNVDIDCVLVSWILTSLLAIKITQGCLNYFILNLAENHSSASSKLLLHKVHGLKQLIKLRLTKEYANKVHWFGLVKTAVKSNAMRILRLDSRFSADEIEDNSSKTSLRKMSIEYLEDLLDKFPKSDIVKLYIIYYHAKKLKNYGVALKKINDLKKNASKLLLLNASLIQYDIQNMGVFAHSNNESELNLSEYLRNISTVAQWKSQMLGQVGLQMSLCEETVTEIPDLAKILTIAQKMYTYKHAVEKKSNKVFNNIPSHYIEPYMMYAHYQLVVNHSVSDYRRYIRYYYKKYKQNEKYFKSNKLIPENLYNNTGLLILSAEKNTLGKILFCTKGIADIYGGDRQRYLGNDWSIIGVPVTRPFYASFCKNYTDACISNQEKGVMGGFAQHKEGYIFEIDFCMDIHLFEGQGLCMIGINRKVNSDKDFVLVNENGEIEGISKKLGRRLNFFDKKSTALKMNVKSISEELGRANEAFNIINLPEKYQPKGRNKNKLSEASSKDEIQEKYKCDMDIEEATKLYTTFSTEGQTIVVKISNKAASQGPSVSEIFSYHCTVKTSNFGSLQLKTFTLEEIESDLKKMRKPSPIHKDPAKLKSKSDANRQVTLEKILSNPNDHERKDTHNALNFEDEKQNGWIDLIRLESERQPRLMPFLTENQGLSSVRTQEENFLPPSSSRNLFTSTSLLRSPNVSPTIAVSKEKEQENNSYKERKIACDINSKSVDEKDEDTSESDLSESGIIKPQQSISSHISASSHPDATLKAYKTALVNSTTPRSFKILCFCFYALLVLLSGSQIQMNYSLNSFLRTLEIKKNILGDSANRDTAVATVHGYATTLWMYANQYMSGVRTAAVNASILTLQTGLQLQIALVGASNHALLIDMQSLDEKTSKLFFQKDVKVYDTYFNAPQQVYMNYTNFGAIDRIIETAGRVWQQTKSWQYTAVANDMYFIFRNAENDLLLKSLELDDILDQSLTDEREAAISLAIDYLIATLVLLGVIAVALYVLIWKQYFTERNNLLAFVKLNPQNIETVHARLIEFKYKIENERPFEKTTIDLDEYFQSTMKRKNARIITVHKKHLQTANYGGILKKYLFHTLKLTIFIFIFMGLVLWSNISAKVSIQYFHKKQAQLKLSGYMKFMTTITSVTTDELLARNNASQILNQWTADFTPIVLDNLSILRENVTVGFLNDDGQYDPIIADILFGSGRCDLFPPGSQSFCDTVTGNGVLLNYLSVLSAYQRYHRNRWDLYNALTNKTTSALNAIKTQYGPMSRPLRVTLQYQSEAIFNLINEAFENDLNSIADQRNMILSVIIVSLVAISIIAWFSLLSIIKAANNQFKKVLQSLPAHIVLQSFLLRLFLMGNSITFLKEATSA